MNAVERRAAARAGLELATSAEADALLDAMPQVVRRLSIATPVRAVSYVGEVRGPVLWSETAAARSASPGAGAVFVCASPSRAFDTPANRVLVQALTLIREAAEMAVILRDDPRVAHARRNGTRAIHYLDHRTLISVPRVRLGGRTRQRVRLGTRRATYAPALALLARAGA